MGSVRPRCPAKLFAGVIYSPDFSSVELKNEIEALYGPADLVSAEMDFNNTEYYRKEMGPGLKRTFFFFKELRPQEKLYRCKLDSNLLEERHLSPGGQRPVNIDPGYLELSNLVLFTTKDFSHRIYAGEGIYAEVTLIYSGKKFNTLPWTYPDYGSEAYIGIFNKARALYYSQLEAQGLV